MSKTIQWLRRCALPALLAASVCAAHAQTGADPTGTAPAAGTSTTGTAGTSTSTTDTTTTTTSTTTTDTSGMAGGMTSGALAGMDMNGADYRLLNSPYYDYVDLKRAQRLGYSDREIATISKIARLSGTPFNFILNRVHQGRTFALLASDYNLRLSDVLNVDDEEARIARYLSLYESLNLLGSERTAYLSTAQTISGPSLAELEARYGQLNAAFPALPATNIETSQIGSAADTAVVAQAPPPPPPPPAPAPEAPPAEVIHTQTVRTVVTHTYHARRHRRHVVRHRVVRHRRHHVKRVVRMGS